MKDRQGTVEAEKNIQTLKEQTALLKQNIHETNRNMEVSIYLIYFNIFSQKNPGVILLGNFFVQNFNFYSPPPPPPPV